MWGWGESVVVLCNSPLHTNTMNSWGRGSLLQAAGEKFYALFGFVLV